MPGKRKKKNDFCYIKDGKILKDTIGLTAKAEREAEEFCEEIKKLKEQRSGKNTDEVDPETKAIVTRILEAFRHGPLKWKPDSELKRKSESSQQERHCPKSPEDVKRGLDTARQSELPNGVVTKNSETELKLSDKKQDGIETNHIKLRCPDERTRNEKAVGEGNASAFDKSNPLINNTEKSELLKRKGEALNKREAKKKHGENVTSTKEKPSESAIFKVADGKMVIRMKKDKGNICIPGAKAKVATAKTKNKTTVEQKDEESKNNSATQKRCVQASGLGVDISKKKDYGSEKSKSKALAADVNAVNTSVTGLKTGTKTGAHAEATGLKVNAGNSEITGIDNRAMLTAAAKTGVSVNAANINAQAIGHAGMNATADISPGIDCFNVNVGLRRNTGASVTAKASFCNINLTIGPPTIGFGLLNMNLDIPFLSGGGGGSSDETGGGNSGGAEGDVGDEGGESSVGYGGGGGGGNGEGEDRSDGDGGDGGLDGGNGDGGNGNTSGGGNNGGGGSGGGGGEGYSGGGGEDSGGGGNRFVIVSDRDSDEDSEDWSGDEDNDVTGKAPKRRRDAYKYDSRYGKMEMGSILVEKAKWNMIEHMPHVTVIAAMKMIFPSLKSQHAIDGKRGENVG